MSKSKEDRSDQQTRSDCTGETDSSQLPIPVREAMLLFPLYTPSNHLVQTFATTAPGHATVNDVASYCMNGEHIVYGADGEAGISGA